LQRHSALTAIAVQSAGERTGKEDGTKGTGAKKKENKNKIKTETKP